ncbi:hypothetical protein BJX66DRAFT_336916 [Aspergillus keveii]|uniref:AT hook motif protein n=1 Tax=Aspergillus keveii TaxID=714993 RepID=A0ABR4G8N4_9EURO
MPMVWNDQADAKLLLAIINMTTTKLNHPAIAEYMGPDCTASAVQHRIQRIKEKAKNNPVLGNSTTEGGTPEKKRGRPRKSAAGTDENAPPADDAEGSAKKPKRTPEGSRKTKAVDQDVKMEDASDGLDDPFA